MRPEDLEEGVKAPQEVKGAPFPAAATHSDAQDRPSRQVPAAPPRSVDEDEPTATTVSEEEDGHGGA